MPFQSNRTGAAKAWFCLNPDQAVSAMTLQNEGPLPVEIKLHSSASVPPSNRDGTLTYDVFQALGADETFATRFPGTTSPGYIWAISAESVTISVSY